MTSKMPLDTSKFQAIFVWCRRNDCNVKHSFDAFDTKPASKTLDYAIHELFYM